MKDYIADFTNHLKDAIEIGSKTNLKANKKEFTNVLICGLGGSGIGGSIVNDIISIKSNIPIISNKDYSIPNFVNESTLVIANSYSGNTEETISALGKCEERGAEIAIITSGGKLKEIALAKIIRILLFLEGILQEQCLGMLLLNSFLISSLF